MITTLMIFGGVMMMVYPFTQPVPKFSEMVSSIGRSLRYAFRLERAPGEMCQTLEKID